MNPHSRHCISLVSAQPLQSSSPPKIYPLLETTLPSQPFNPEVIDTFCLHWPDMHSYVLVRVLEKTIAILPVRSRLAFLYFHHAPLPTYPSPKEPRKDNIHPKRIQNMFKNWKHTLILDEQPDISPKISSNVTLADVMSYEPSLKTGWIHAPCTVSDDVNMYDNTIVLTTKHTVIRLTCRCFSEKMMFLNLVKLKQQHHLSRDIQKEESDDSEEDQEESNSMQLMDHLLETNLCQIDNIEKLMVRLDATKETISSYTKQLLDLERSLDILSGNTQAIQFQSLNRTLNYVNHQIYDSNNCLASYKDRLSELQQRISIHSDYLMRARQQYEDIKNRIKNHACYPWLYTTLATSVILLSFIVTYYIYPVLD